MKHLFLALTAVLIVGFQTVANADYATTPQPYPGQPYPQPYPGQPYPGQPYPGQPYPQPYPGQPYYPNQPNPYYGPCAHPGAVPFFPQPYVTCFAQGMANGALFYGVGFNMYAANQWAMYACQSSGQYCQLTGCR